METGFLFSADAEDTQNPRTGESLIFERVVSRVGNFVGFRTTRPGSLWCLGQD